MYRRGHCAKRVRNMAKRVALAGFLHETNTFAPTMARMEDFVQGGGYMPMARGDALMMQGRGINLGIGGAVEFGESAGWEMVPILWAGAIPSAHVCKTAYQSITDEIISGLEAAGPLDGVFLDLHGAMVAEHEDDGEGAFLTRVRAAVGQDVPIAAALDLHGNITEAMVAAADVLVGFRTYPHVDMAETGTRAAAQLDTMMARGEPFAKAFRRLPFLVPIAWQSTRVEPGRGLYKLTAELEGGAVASTSFFFGFPAADFPGCGPTVVCYGETQTAADAAADAIERAVLGAEPALAGESFEPDAGVLEAMRIAKTARNPLSSLIHRTTPVPAVTATPRECCGRWCDRGLRVPWETWSIRKQRRRPMPRDKGLKSRSRSEASQVSPATPLSRRGSPSRPFLMESLSPAGHFMGVHRWIWGLRPA